MFGSLLARLLVFKSVDRIGASRSSPVVATNVFFATVLLGERLGVVHILGIVLIVAGVSVISWELARESDPESPIQNLEWSLALPLLAAFLVGVEPIFVFIGLAEGTTAIPGFAIKAVTATTGFLAYLGGRVTSSRTSSALIGTRSGMSAPDWRAGSGSSHT